MLKIGERKLTQMNYNNLYNLVSIVKLLLISTTFGSEKSKLKYLKSVDDPQDVTYYCSKPCDILL